MISRRRFFHLGDRWEPTWELRLFRGLDSWLVGLRWEHHPSEWHAEAHLGPVMLRLEHVDRGGVRLRDGIDAWLQIRWWDFARTKGGFEWMGQSIELKPRRLDDAIATMPLQFGTPVEWKPWSNWHPPFPNVWDLVPKITAQRGGISFLRPPVAGTPLEPVDLTIDFCEPES